MAKEPFYVAPEVANSGFEADGGDTNEPSKSRFRAQEREGVTFDNAGLESHYKPIAKYEGLHRYDPDFDWEPEEERRIVRKVSGSFH